MNLLFVHDVKAEIYGNDVFARSYGYDIWKERYLPNFNKIQVCFRTKKTNKNLKGISDISSGPRVGFDKRIGMFKGPEVFFSKRIKEILRDDIKENEAVIVRLDSFLGLQTISECRRANKPYMIELVGCAWDSFWNHGLSGKMLAPYLFMRTKKEVKRAPFVVYVTSEFLQNRYPTRGVNTNISNVKLNKQNPEDLDRRLEKIANSKEKIVLGTAANVDIRYKGQQFVLEALGILKKKGLTNFEYQILGAGDQTFLLNMAKKYNVQDQVKMLGSFSHEKVFEWLKKDLDVYIQPSLQEGLPRSVIEAMSVGLPCIGSDVAGIPELLDSVWVFPRKKNKGKEIAELLLKIDKNNLEEQAIRNFKEAKKYDYDLLLEKRYEILEKYKSFILEE